MSLTEKTPSQCTPQLMPAKQGEPSPLEAGWDPERESVISCETRIEGNIFTNQPIQIYGKINGDITASSDVECSGGKVIGNIKGVSVRIVDESSVTGNVTAEKYVVVDDGSALDGDVFAAEVYINGRITGNLSATRMISIASCGKVAGNVSACELKVVTGGTINGIVEVSSGSCS